MEIGVVIGQIASYFNPWESSFDEFSFMSLPLDKKVTTVFLSAVSSLFFGIGSLAAYRLCLKVAF